MQKSTSFESYSYIMRLFNSILLFVVVFFIFSCTPNKNENLIDNHNTSKYDTIIVDCHYTFDEATEGTNAPKSVVEQLELITVHYYAMDGKVHRGQILTNKLIANDLRIIFNDMLQCKFPVAKVIPIVKYDWNDEASMNDNNTYSFCYRNIDYSKHAYGLAIDINPMQNPNRWKPEFSYRKNKPEGAVYNPNHPGTFTQNNRIVLLFKDKGFFWGRYYKRNYDDHHFEKKFY